MKAFDRKTPTYDAARFTWTGTRGVTEASDLGLKWLEPHTPCYTDACDEGLTLRNPRTGTTKEYYFVKYDDQAWHYQAVAGEGSLTIWND